MNYAQAGEIGGYGWGHRQQRCLVTVDHYGDSPTYDGAWDCLSGERGSCC